MAAHEVLCKGIVNVPDENGPLMIQQAKRRTGREIDLFENTLTIFQVRIIPIIPITWFAVFFTGYPK